MAKRLAANAAVPKGKRRTQLGPPNAVAAVRQMVERCQQGGDKFSLGDAQQMVEIHRLLHQPLVNRRRLLVMSAARAKLHTDLPPLPDLVWLHVFKVATPDTRKLLAQCSQYYSMLYRSRWRAAVLTPELCSDDKLTTHNYPMWLNNDALRLVAIEHCAVKYRMRAMTTKVVPKLMCRSNHYLVLFYRHHGEPLQMGARLVEHMMCADRVLCCAPRQMTQFVRDVHHNNKLNGLEYPTLVLLDNDKKAAADGRRAELLHDAWLMCSANNTCLVLAVPSATTKYPVLATMINAAIAEAIRGAVSDRLYCREERPDSLFQPIDRYLRHAVRDGLITAEYYPVPLKKKIKPPVI